MSIKLSVIIPCYNSEATLEATLESVMDQVFDAWEIIIVNDGSNDNTEDIALRWTFLDKRIKYFSKSNEGLGKARNYGVERAIGIYILPLDSDNLVEKSFVKDAVKIFESNTNVGVVHGHAEYFGERNGLWEVEEYNFKKILVGNYIDACAIYRKKLWVKVGGYDENMPYQGNEDWEFWLALGVLNVKFHHLNKITFKYFVSNNSMIRSFNNEMIFMNHDYIFKKYSKQYEENYSNFYSLYANNERKHRENLKSKKVVINLFTKMFFGIKFFKNGK
jgi:glycosyltransferase involved in cell wall biosynthesis